jgi:hypothetical protein
MSNSRFQKGFICTSAIFGEKMKNFPKGRNSQANSLVNCRVLSRVNCSQPAFPCEPGYHYCNPLHVKDTCTLKAFLS